MLRAGPVGEKCYGNRDVEWDDKGRNNISQIYVTYDDEILTSVQFGYVENGALVLSKKYGTSEGDSLRVVKLKKDEYVTGLSGVLGWNGGIGTLTFHTNLKKRGPIGCSDQGYEDCSKIKIKPKISNVREFGGFFGSYNDNFLSSIGMYVSPTADV